MLKTRYSSTRKSIGRDSAKELERCNKAMEKQMEKLREKLASHKKIKNKSSIWKRGDNNSSLSSYGDEVVIRGKSISKQDQNSKCLPVTPIMNNIRIENNLLNGEYDEYKAQKSFQDAINVWREISVDQPVNPNQVNNCEIQTEKEKKRIEIEEMFKPDSMSYFQQLMKSKPLNHVPVIEYPTTIAKNEVIDDYEWGSEEEEVLRGILEIKMEKAGKESSDYFQQVTVQDITENEDQIILQLLESNRVVEFIPSSALQIFLK